MTDTGTISEASRYGAHHYDRKARRCAAGCPIWPCNVAMSEASGDSALARGQRAQPEGREPANAAGPGEPMRPAWLDSGRVVYDSTRDRFGRVAAVGPPFGRCGYVGNGSDTVFVVPYPGGGIGWEAQECDLTPASPEAIR